MAGLDPANCRSGDEGRDQGRLIKGILCNDRSSRSRGRGRAPTFPGGAGRHRPAYSSGWPPPMINRRLYLRLRNRPPSTPPRPPPLAASSLPRRKYARYGPNTGCEAPLHQAGARRFGARSSIISPPAHPKDGRRVQARIRTVIDLLPYLFAARPPDKRSHNSADSRHPVPVCDFLEANEAEIIIHAVRHAARDPSSMPGSS